MHSARNLEAIARPPGTVRPPCDIAADALRSIPKSGSAWIFGRPYLMALKACASWDSRFGPGDARDIALYLLSNIGNWRGAEARRIKQEIRDALGMTRARKETP